MNNLKSILFTEITISNFFTCRCYAPIIVIEQVLLFIINGINFNSIFNDRQITDINLSDKRRFIFSFLCGGIFWFIVGTYTAVATCTISIRAIIRVIILYEII